MYYSNEDFENFYVRYKAEGLPKNITVKDFCIRNNVPWNLFDKWFRDTHHRIRPVQVTGLPDAGNPETGDSRRGDDGPVQERVDRKKPQPDFGSGRDSVRIMVDIRMTNGMQIRQKNLSYGQLVGLVEKLEAIC